MIYAVPKVGRKVAGEAAYPSHAFSALSFINNDKLL